MNTHVKFAAAALLFIMFATVYVASISTAFAQGGLTPPGAPAPTMKTLDQIEARRPISAATTIMSSGSYYLTTNITVWSGHGITIVADQVTLDLNGFTIRSTSSSGSGYGVYVYRRHDITIANGFIVGGVTNNGSGSFSGGGFYVGIYAYGDHNNIKVSGISVTGCYDGIDLEADTTVVDGCSVRTASSYGIRASTVKSSIAVDCGGPAIEGNLVSNCRGVSVGQCGIRAVTVLNSYGCSGNYYYDSYGIDAETVENSYGCASNTVSGSYSASGIGAKTVKNSYGYASSSGGEARGITAGNVQNSYGYGYSLDDYAYGILCNNVENSEAEGESDGYYSYGIAATTVENSFGQGSGSDGYRGYGIQADSVSGSVGWSYRNSSSSRGIYAWGPVDTSSAYCPYGYAIYAESASNCRGESDETYGIRVESAHNCYGEGAGGIYANTATGCRGVGTTGYGVYGLHTVLNCDGFSSSGRGIYGFVVQNCYGQTSTGYHGLYAAYSAIGSRGNNGGSGTGIYGYILSSCTGYSSSGTAVSAIYKYDMP